MDISVFLRLQPGFDHFPEQDIATLTRMLNVQMYPPKQVFTTRGVENEYLYLILEGAVVTNTTHDLSVDSTDHTLRAGEWFGFLSLVARLPAFENRIAVGNVVLASFHRTHFDELLELAPPVGLHFLYMLAKQVARTLAMQNQMRQAQPAGPGHSIIRGDI